jgi:hypothetical protein
LLLLCFERADPLSEICDKNRQLHCHLANNRENHSGHLRERFRGRLVIVVIGVLLVLAGLSLAIAPLGAIRLANTIRFVPYSRSSEAVRYYRTSGCAVVALGLVVVIAAR